MRLILGWLFALLTTSALAQGKGAASLPDPAQLQTINLASGRDSMCCGNDVNSKTARNPTINTGIRNLVLVIGGQSNMGDNHGAAYTPTNATAIDNLHLNDGQIYAAADPLLGSANDLRSLGPANFNLRLADNLITANKFDRVILLIIQISGTGIAQWDPAQTTTGPGVGRFTAAFARLKARGITPGLTNTTIAILWGLGETDCALATPQATFAASLGNVITAARAAGFTQNLVPFFVAEESWVSGAGCAAIEAAQTSIVNTPNNIWGGPNSDSLNNSNRQDTTHFNPTGAAANATLWVTALHAFGAPF